MKKHRSGRRLLVATFGYAVLAAILLWPLTGNFASTVPAGGDNLYVAWSLAWVAHALTHEPASVFSANIFHPASPTLVFSDPVISSGLLLLPIWVLTHDPALCLNVLLLGSLVLSALATRALLVEWTGSERAGLVGGLLFGFSPIRMAQFHHVQLLPFWWMPLALLGLDRFLRRGRFRDLLGCSLVLSLQVYTSLYLGAFTVAALCLLFLNAAATGRIAVPWRRVFVGTFAGILLTTALCLPLGWAFADVRATWAPARTIESNIRYSASPASYLSASEYSALWGERLSTFTDAEAPWEKRLFPGAASLVLVLIALPRLRRDWTARFGLLLGVVCAVASLGPYLWWSGHRTEIPLPYLWGYEWLFPLKALRTPARWGLLVAFAVAIVGAAGARRLRPAILGPLLLLAVAEARLSPFPVEQAPSVATPPPGVEHIAGGNGPVIELPLAKTDPERRRNEVPRMVYSTVHWRPLVNGYSGYTPPPYRALAELTDRESPEILLPLLAAWNVRTIVLHLDELSTSVRERWENVETRPGVSVVYADATTRVLDSRVEPAPFATLSARLPGVPTLPASERVPLDVVSEVPDSPGVLAPQQFGWRRATARWTGAGGGTHGWAKVYCPPVLFEGMKERPWFVDAPERPGRYELRIETPCASLAGEVTVSSDEASR